MEHSFSRKYAVSAKCGTAKITTALFSETWETQEATEVLVLPVHAFADFVFLMEDALFYDLNKDENNKIIRRNYVVEKNELFKVYHKDHQESSLELNSSQDICDLIRALRDVALVVISPTVEHMRHIEGIASLLRFQHEKSSEEYVINFFENISKRHPDFKHLKELASVIRGVIKETGQDNANTLFHFYHFVRSRPHIIRLYYRLHHFF